MLTTSVSGLRGNADMHYLCTARSCEGTDNFTKDMFRGLQSQLNRYANVVLKDKSNSSFGYLRLEVDGKIGSSTVVTYRFVAQGLQQGGAAPPIPHLSATKEVLAAQAESTARWLQAVADRAGIPPASTSLPGMPSGGSAGTPGVVQQSPVPNIDPSRMNNLLIQATRIPGAPVIPEAGLPHSELVSSGIGPGVPGFGPVSAGIPTKSGPPWYLWAGIGVVTVGILYFTLRKR